jgi:hypothetical protein
MRQSSHHSRGSDPFALINAPPWESLRECASDARMHIAAEMKKVHMINSQRLPSLDDAVSFPKADCGVSGAVSLSSLLDKVLFEHASAVPSREELVAQKQRVAAAAREASQTQLQPLGKHIRGRRGAVIGKVESAGGSADVGAHGQQRVGRLPLISENADDDALGWDAERLSLRHFDGVSIKSRTHSRQGKL